MAGKTEVIMYVDHRASVDVADKEMPSYDSLDVEKFIFSLEYKAVLVLLFKEMGYGHKEIPKIMGISSWEYYKLCDFLKDEYQKKYR
jgi:hypothetical protein